MPFTNNIIIINYLLLAICILLATTIHEFTKALFSTKFGDLAPRNEGRLTLNPFSHFEPIGFILFLICGFGWGKPVNTSALYYKDRRSNIVTTYSMPILVNFILGIIFIYLSKIIEYNTALYMREIGKYLQMFLVNFYTVSISLALFNLIPVYPLAGYKIFTTVLSQNKVIKLTQYEGVLQVVLIFALIIPITRGLLSGIVNIIIGIFV